jgi:protein TonB
LGAFYIQGEAHMFEQTFVHQGGAVRRPWTVAASLTGQLILTAIVVAVPLMQTARLNFTPPIVLYSPPRILPEAIQPVAQTAARSTVPVTRVLFQPRLAGPTRVPERVTLVEGPSLPPTDVGVAGNGVGDPIAAITDALVQPKPPAQAPAPAKIKSMRVSVGVQQAMLLHYVKPPYPPLARAARISGTVRLTAIIATDGSIQRLQVISGHPLLVKSAIDAVQQWRYKPTLLNGDAVEVITEIDVNFTLSN